MRTIIPWTDEDNDILKRMWEHGDSASVIGAAIKKTRNAIIGRAHRMGLAGRVERVNQKATGEHKPREKRERRVPNWSPKQVYKPASIKKVRMPEPTGPTIGLMHLEPHHCRWPFGDPRDPGFGYCGAPRMVDSSYCEHHRHRGGQRIKAELIL